MPELFEIRQELSTLMDLEERGHHFQLNEYTIYRDEDPIEALTEIANDIGKDAIGYNTRIIAIKY